MSKTMNAVIHAMNHAMNRHWLTRAIDWLLRRRSTQVEFDLPDAPPQYAQLQFLPAPEPMGNAECASLIGVGFHRPIGAPHYNYFWKRDKGGVLYRLYRRIE